MDHLTGEALARLVDEAPAPREAEHLAECAECAAELVALRDQTEALRALPEIVPPRGDWRVLEARLRSEGLVRDPGLARRLGLTRTPGWMPAAAALVLFLGGTAVGATLGGDAATVPREEVALAAAEEPASTVEEAATAVRQAEQRYVSAVSRYRELMEREGLQQPVGDPLSRYAALEHLVSVSQAAVRQVPGDPFLNGFLASVLAEREAAARQVRQVSSGDNWF
ncbi:MAG TPA: hypothetical protein VFQ22_14060 [Longimicrobiales bacterium]|nr:hypothetical protein [Longimicrobiales bacterium]